MGCKMVALKAGPYGWYFRTGPVQGLKDMGRLKLKNLSDWDDRELWSPSFHIDRIASSTGAGDSSIAGFLTAILRGHSLSECLERANSAGRQNLTAMDALSGLKSWEEVERQIPQLRVNDLVHLQETDWRWESGTRQWQR